MRKFRACAFASLNALAVATFASPAIAQETEAREDEAALSSSGNAIVVTARRVEENLSDVPLSVVAVSGDDLQEANINEIEDLVLLTPGLTFNESANSRGRGASIRGVGTNLFGDGVEASVATYIDGVLLGRQAMGINDLIDIERVEVLRGPQSTLFGKNASAGVINIITKSPNLDSFEADANVRFGHQSADDANDLQIGATIAGPVAEGVAGFRLTGYLNDRDGYLTNVNTGNSFQDKKEYGGRFKFLAEPTKNFSFLVTADYSRRDQNCCITSALTYGSFRSTTPEFDAISPGPRNTDVFIDREDNYFQDQEQWGIAGQIDWTVGTATITSITALREWTVQDNNEFENNPPGVGNDVLRNDVDLDHTQFSQELRIAGDVGPLSYVGGFFYFDQRVDAKTSLLLNLRPGPPVPGGNDVARRVDTESFAVFGQLDFKLTDNLILLAGGRFTDETLNYSFDRSVADGGFFGFVPPITFAGETFDDNFSYLIGLQYYLGDNMVYATYSRGYKGQGVNVNNFVSSFEVNNGLEVVDPEIPTNYEIGARTSWLDGKLAIDATLFYTEFKDYQLSVFDPDTNSSGLRNAANLETYGLEASIRARLSDNFSLNAGLTLMDATYQDFPNGPCFPLQGIGPGSGCVDVDNSGTQNAPDVQNLAGAPLQNAPDLTFNVAASFNAPLTASGWELFSNAVWYYQDDVQFNVNQDPLATTDSFHRVNLTLGVSSPGDTYRVSVFARNLLDQEYPLTVTSAGTDDPGGQNQFLPFDYARVIGVSLAVRLR